MRIPAVVHIAGLKIQVVHDPLAVAERQYIGKSEYSKQRIILDKTAAPRETTEQACVHEVVHWILHVMNEFELQNNEKFVDVFSQLLYQALTQSEWEIELPDGPLMSLEVDKDGNIELLAQRPDEPVAVELPPPYSTRPKRRPFS